MVKVTLTPLLRLVLPPKAELPSTLNTSVPIPGHEPDPSPSNKVSKAILTRVARLTFVTSSVLNTSIPYCLPFSVRSSYSIAKCASGLAVDVPVSPTNVLELVVSRLLTKVGSLIVKNCRFSGVLGAR